MFTLKITGLTAQRDMDQLVRVLLQVPGLDSKQVSVGLKVPPFTVLSVEHESQALAIKSALDKFGAISVIEDSNAPRNTGLNFTRLPVKSNKDRNKFPAIFWIALIVFLCIPVVLQFISSDDEGKSKQTTQRPAAEKKTAEKKQEARQEAKPAERIPEKPPVNYGAQNKNDLGSALSKNPYNTGAWKALYERLDKEGDTASARKAKDSYEKALRAQKVLASLAKTFGNSSRVEIADDAVYYRTSKDLTDSEFYHEAEKLRDSLNSRFPTKDMVLENFKSDNTVQTIRLKPTYTSNAQ